MTQIKIPDEYSYIYDIVRCVQKHKEIPLDELNLVGGRKSAKTTTLILMWVLLCIYCNVKDFGFICFRNEVQSADDLFADIIAILDAYDIPYNTKQSRREINVNGNILKVVGVNNNRKGNKAKKSGLPRFSSVKYAFIFFEERFEFNEDDVRAVIEAVRSISSEENNTQYIVLNACNPWAKSSKYISYCGRWQGWNVNILKTTGSQCGVYEIPVGEGRIKRALFHYTNWRVAKQFITESEIKNILDTWNHDKKRAMTADFGLPGYEDGAIYTHILNNLIPTVIWQEHEYLVGGGDYGWGRDERSGKTVFFFMGYSQEKGLDIYGEYVSDNHNRVKTPNQVAREIVEFYANQMRQYCNRIGWASPFNIKVRVDNAAESFIAILNTEALRMGIKWISFMKCKKFPVNDRIETTIAVAGRGLFRYNKNTDIYPVNLLIKEMELSRYEDTEQQKREKINDHAINGFEYSIEPFMYKMARGYVDEKYLKGKRVW